jgi:hypothetical protein
VQHDTQAHRDRGINGSLKGIADNGKRLMGKSLFSILGLSERDGSYRHFRQVGGLSQGPALCIWILLGGCELELVNETYHFATQTKLPSAGAYHKRGTVLTNAEA